MNQDFLSDLHARGLVHQCTDEAGLRKHLSEGVRSAYIGYDPTADSLTIGNLVTIMLLRRYQMAGHRPVVVMGGGTGLIGDPSGKSAERELLTEDRVRSNVESQKRIFGSLLDFSKGPIGAAIVNNVDWLEKLSYIAALRDIGKYFSVNQMIQRDSVKERLNNREQGISYTEFSYMILQAYDYVHLYKDMGVTLQMGGSDQWGNIVSGTDLIRRQATGAETASFGLTTPLVTKADGTKFGKTESGAVWLTADRTSPYAYYQFWLNTADTEVERFLKVFTLLEIDAVNDLLAQHKADPGARPAQRALAREATDLLHGKSERERAEAAAAALFSGEIAALPLATLEEAFAAAPSSKHDKAALASEGIPLLDLLAQTTLAKSKGEARQFLTDGSVSVNGKKAGMGDKLTSANLLHGSIIALRRGKKNWHITRWG